MTPHQQEQLEHIGKICESSMAYKGDHSDTFLRIIELVEVIKRETEESVDA